MVFRLMSLSQRRCVVAASAMHIPLMIAASRGRWEVCELLLRHGANPELRDSNGKTALELAEDRCCTAAVEVLRRW